MLAGLFPALAPEERHRFRHAALAYMCVAASALVSRAMGDALFLSRFPAEFLPFLYIGSALLIALVAFVFGALIRRVALTRLILLVLLALVAAALLLRLGLVHPDPALRVAAYFLADLNIQIPMMLFWTFAALVFNPREAKRLFGVMAAGGTAACIAAGFLVRPFASRFGTESLLFVVAALLVGAALCVLAIARRESARLQFASRPVPAPAGAKAGYYASLLKVPQIRELAGLMVASTVGILVVDFVFKSQARAHYQGAALAGFIGSFYAGANVAALAVQLLVVHRLLQKGGVLVSLAVLPAALLATAAGVAATGAFAWTIAARIVDPVLNFTVNNAAVQMLYQGIKKQTRSQARAFVEGICRPVAMAFTGAALLATAGRVGPRALGATAAAVALLWLVGAWRNHRAYVAGLVDSVGARRFEAHDVAAAYDRSLQSHIRQALLDAGDEDVPYLIHVLGEMGELDATLELRQILGRDNPAVKVAAIEYLKTRGTVENLPLVLEHMEHPDPDVRAAAVHAANAWGSPAEVIAALERRLEDPQPGVRAAAAAELINTRALDVVLTAGGALRAMLTSSDPASRIAATHAMGHIRHTELTRLLETLLEDPDRDVLRVALAATRAHPTPPLVPRVARLLDDARVAAAAAETMAAFGAAALDPLAAELAAAAPEAAAARPGIHRLPGIVARIGDARGLDALRPALASLDLQLRAEAITAYARLLKLQPLHKPYLPEVNRSVQREIAAASALQSSLRRVGALAGGEVLRAALEDEYRCHLKNAFVLLDASTPSVDLNSVYLGIMRGSSESKAEALELLDNVLEAESKASLLALLESRGPEGGEAAAAAEELRRLLDRPPSPWVAVGALYAAAESGLAALAAEARRLVADPSPVVRETALHALGRLGEAAAVAEACALLRADPSPAVRELAAALAG